MHRTFLPSEPAIINHIENSNKHNKSEGGAQKSHVFIGTTNKNKLKEFTRLLPMYEIFGVELKIEEIQSLDPHKVATQKAIDAFVQNNNNPILVEDTSMEIKGLGNRPGTYVTDFFSDVEMRKMVVKDWLRDKDKSAVVRVIMSIHDGKETHLFEGTVTGTISEELRGTNGFGFDDMFIPDGQRSPKPLTFAQMTPAQKDKYSMRAKAAREFLKADLNFTQMVWEIPEPFESESQRLRLDFINNTKATKFAYTLEAVHGNVTKKDFTAPIFLPIKQESNIYFDRFMLSEDSASIGIIVTDIDKSNVKLKQNGDCMIWQMGPERRRLALAQRAEYFMNNTDKILIKTIERMEKEQKWPVKNNKRHATLENMLGIDYKDTPFNARAIKEIGYKKMSSGKELSRRKISQYGLINKIGKYPRLTMGIGSMPAVTGWRDVILTGILGHMPVFITRNSIYAENNDLRRSLIKQVNESLNEQAISSNLKNLFRRNIGVGIGTSSPDKEIDNAKRFYYEGGIKLFRIYTINADPRFEETAVKLRKALGDEIEIFAGQLVDKEQGIRLVENAGVDGLVFGHGGGRQCTSATNGMALSTVEEIYSVLTDQRFNDTTLLVEGGVGQSVGGLLVLGIDGILYNQQLTKGTIETGGIFLQHKNGEYCQPYHGSASAPTMIIEAANDKLVDTRLNYSGRTKVPEGKKGYTFYSEKANSMAFWIDEFKHQMARTLADLGVENIYELREFVKNYDKELIRVVSSEAAQFSQAYKNTK